MKLIGAFVGLLLSVVGACAQSTETFLALNGTFINPFLVAHAWAALQTFNGGIAVTGTLTQPLPQFQVLQGNVSNLAAPVALSTAIDAAIGSTRGSILERGASNWGLIAPGTSGLPWVSNGAGADPGYQACGLNGGCLGASQSAATVNQIPVFPGSGGGAAPTSAPTWFDNAYCNTVGFVVARVFSAWTCQQAIPIPANWFTGVDPTGATDSTIGINNVIAACPVNGCTILVCGQYKIATNTGVVMGNGTTSTNSTRQGGKIEGCGAPNVAMFDAWTGYVTTSPATFTFTGTSATGPVISINGPLRAWEVKNLFIDCGSLANVGFLVSSAAYGRAENVAVRNCRTIGIQSTAIAFAPGGNFNNSATAFNNHYKDITIQVPAVANAIGFLLDGFYQNAGSIGATACPCLVDTDVNSIDNIFILEIGGAISTNAMVFKNADTNSVHNLAVLRNTANTGFGIAWDYSGDPNLPANNKVIGGFVSASNGGSIVNTQANNGTAPTGPTTRNWVVYPTLVNGDTWNSIANTEVKGGGGQSFTATPTCGTATITTNTAKFQTDGRTVEVEVDFTITALGTCTNVLTFTLPFTSVNSSGLAGRDTSVSNKGFVCSITGSSGAAGCTLSDATNFGTARLVASGSYHMQ